MLFCDFLHIDKHENLLQIDALILMGMINIKIFLTLTFTSEEHSQSTQNSKFATTLYNISKKVRNEVHFEHADKH